MCSLIVIKSTFFWLCFVQVRGLIRKHVEFVFLSDIIFSDVKNRSPQESNYGDFKLKKHFVPRGLYNNISALKGFTELTL